MWIAVKRSIGSKVVRNGDNLFVELEKQWNSLTMTYVDELDMQQNIEFLILSLNILKSFEHSIFYTFFFNFLTY